MPITLAPRFARKTSLRDSHRSFIIRKSSYTSPARFSLSPTGVLGHLVCQTIRARAPRANRDSNVERWHKRKGGRARKSVDRFRHASFVEGTSFISTWPGEREERVSSLPLVPLFLSVSVAIVFGDEKKRRQISQARGQPLDRRRRRFVRLASSLFNSSF